VLICPVALCHDDWIQYSNGLSISTSTQLSRNCFLLQIIIPKVSTTIYLQLISTDEKSEHLKWSQWSSYLNFNRVKSREIANKLVGFISHCIILPISDKIYLCSYAHLRLTATTGFRIAMVSLSQLQLSWVVGIVDTLVGLITHPQGKQAFYVQLASTDEKSEHLKWSQRSPSHNITCIQDCNGLSISTSTQLSRRYCWHSRWIDHTFYSPR
jgi:hypothetical protein